MLLFTNSQPYSRVKLLFQLINKNCMNFSSINTRYKQLEKDVHVVRDQKRQSIEDLQKNQKKNQLMTPAVNAYTGKSYSSIKSLIRRLQAAGNIKINYPRIRTRNQRADIFLQGGSITHIKRIACLEQSKTSKKYAMETRKTQLKLQVNPYNIEDYENDVQQVFIRKIRKMQQPEKQPIYKNSSTIKTQVHKNIPTNYLSRTFNKQQISETPLLESVDFKAFQDDNQMSDNKFLKSEQDGKFSTSKANTEQKQRRLQKRNISTRQTTSMHTNMSQNTIKSHSKYVRNPNLPKSIINSNVQIKLLAKRHQSISQTSKPLFYVTQDELKQLRITARNFIVTEYPSKQIITGCYYKQVAEIASLTKIVTFYCCLLLVQKYNINIDRELLIIDQQVQHTTGTSAELLEGDLYTFRQICYGLMLPSGNDAALALAKWGGRLVKKNQSQNSLKAFMVYMNATCTTVGMKSSYFGNPHGLPHPKSGSTVQDVAILINQALVIPFFREVIKTKSYRCWIQNNGLKRQVVWQNTQKLLRRKGFIGVKTGVTVTAGPCLSTCYEINDKIFTIVLLKTSKLSRRFKQTRRILGKVLSKINFNFYRNQIRQILKNDAELDSDNSQDEQQFNYDRNDAIEMKKRLKIITYEM